MIMYSELRAKDRPQRMSSVVGRRIIRAILLLVLVLPVLATSAAAQAKGDWSAVMRIDRGSVISLKAPRKIKCVFVGATEEKLFCEQMKWFRSIDRLDFNRADIREVRLRLELPDELNTDANACVGAAAGVAAGAIANAVHANSGNSNLYLGMVGSVVGGAGLRNVRIVHLYRTIYRR